MAGADASTTWVAAAENCSRMFAGPDPFTYGPSS
jgi:hypothetical protein